MTHYKFKTYEEWEAANIDFSVGDTIEVTHPERGTSRAIYEVQKMPTQTDPIDDLTLPDKPAIYVNPKHKASR